jgi:RHS repeat-associated protein
VTGYDDGYRPLGQSVTLPSSEGALAGTYTTGYTYAADGQPLPVTLPAGGGLTAETVTTHYDSANLPETMNGSLGWGVYVASSLYSSYGQLMQADLGSTYANYVNYDYEYGTDRLSRTWLVRQNVNGNDVDLTYTYDDAGNPTKVSDQPTGQAADTQCFAYDGLDRLASAWTPAGSDCAPAPTVAALGGPAPYWTDYTISPAGNRLSQTRHTSAGDVTDQYSYPAAGSARPHAVTSVARTAPTGAGTSTYAYDATGNTTGRAVAGSVAQQLTWDAEGRLATATQGSATSSYLYTADGDRLLRKQSGTTTVYLPGGQELTLTAATSAVTALRYYAFGGQTVAVRTGKAGSTVSSLVSDPHQTATVAIGNTTQAVTKRRMDPYGNVRGGAVSWPGDRSFLNKPLDATGLTSIGARYYDALIGRFVSVDPVMDLGSPQQWAAYSYADNNPIARSDPTGLLSIGSAWKNVTSAVSRGGSATSRWVRTHQAEIVGGVVGAVVTGGCLAASWGVGSVGCAALGGAAAGAVSNLWKSQVQKTQKFSWGSLALDTGVGAVVGAVSGGAGQGGGAGVAAGGVVDLGADLAGRSAGAVSIPQHPRGDAREPRPGRGSDPGFRSQACPRRQGRTWGGAW